LNNGVAVVDCVWDNGEEMMNLWYLASYNTGPADIEAV